MEEKNSFSEKLSDFFAGKGFYIVLLLCAALIATSIWLMADGSRADVETNGGETEYRITEDGPDHAGDLPVMSVSGVPGVKNTPAPPAQRGDARCGAGSALRPGRRDGGISPRHGRPQRAHGALGAERGAAGLPVLPARAEPRPAACPGAALSGDGEHDAFI